MIGIGLGITGPRRAGGEFVPTDIAGLTLWLKDTGWYQDTAGTTPAAADGDPVGRWNDQDASPHNATQGTAAARATLRTGVQNGRSIVRWDGTDDHLIVPDLGVTAGHLFLVAKTTSLSNDSRLWSQHTGVASQAGAIGIRNSRIEIWNGTDWAVLGGGAVLNTSDFFALEFEASGTQVRLRVNGADQSQVTCGWNYSGPEVSLGGKFLNQFGNPLSGDIGEVLLYNAALSGANQDKVLSYLGQRWGITVS